jgi:hypothetical protein
VFLERYEHHLDIKKYSYPRNMPWRHILVFPERYEHHLDIKKYSYPRNRPWRHILVFRERYENNLDIKSTAISVTGRGGTYLCFLIGTNTIYI